MLKQNKVDHPGTSIGHNSMNFTDEQKIKLRGYIDELERLDKEAKEISKERGEIFKAAKENHFDTQVMRQVLKMRKMDALDREALEAAVDAYQLALGDFSSTPLGRAMMPKQGEF